MYTKYLKWGRLHLVTLGSVSLQMFRHIVEDHVLKDGRNTLKSLMKGLPLMIRHSRIRQVGGH